MPDISETLAPKSDQLDNIDLRGSDPRVFTVTSVNVNPNADQPVVVHLAEFPRPWKPGKNMRRVLAHYWGRESDGWVGKQVELFSDERVTFGNETPGGTRISRMSHIEKIKSPAPVMLSKGKAGTYKVELLPPNAAARKQPPAPKLDPETERVLADLKAKWDATTAPDERADIEAQRDRLLSEATP